ncbi:MAG: hypothetical protein K6F49_01385 [Saccharofermentans sp.]|nr:hypothetical protein [Saccharofermentans sp.]
MKKYKMTYVFAAAIAAAMVLQGCAGGNSSSSAEPESISIESASETESAAETEEITSEETVTETEGVTETGSETEFPEDAGIDTEGLLAALGSCEGIGQTSGYELKVTTAAARLIVWSSINDLSADPEAAQETVKGWYEGLSERYQNALLDCLSAIIEKGNLIIEDIDAVTGDLNDAGVFEEINDAVAREFTASSWQGLAEILSEVGDIAN